MRIQAHFESTGGLSRYSHVSAARLHECHVWDVGPRIHVTTPYANSVRSAGSDVRTHRADLPPSDLTTLWAADGREILTTSIERTVLDCARILPLEQAAVIGDHLAYPADVRRRLLAMRDRSRILHGQVQAF